MLFQTNRCYVEILSLEDINDALELFENENVRKYLGGTLTIHEAINKLNNWILDKESIYLSIKLKKVNKFIGIVSLSPYYDERYKEVSYQFLEQYWGNGYAYEVVLEFLNYCFKVLNLDEVISETQTLNIHSCRLLEKLGYTLKGEVYRYNNSQSVYYKKLNEDSINCF